MRPRFGRKPRQPYMDFQDYLADLSAAAPRDGVVAFFDLDRTLISGYSVTALAWERVRSRSVSVRRMLSQAGVFVGYGLGRTDYHDLLESTVADLAGVSEAEMVRLGEQAFHRRVRGWIYQEARVLLELHRRKGHQIVMVTSATRYQATPIARALGVEHLYCTELEVAAGRITGRAEPCFGAGKLAAAERFVERSGTDLRRAFFYSDSSDDLPLLEAVGQPVAANAKLALARLAAERGWPSLVFGADDHDGQEAA